MERIQQLIGSARFKLAVDLNYRYILNLENNSKPLKNNLNKIISTLSQEQVSVEERQKSTKYRFNGRLNIITDNSINTVDNNNNIRPNNNDWDPLFDGNPPTTPNNWVLQILYPYKIDKYSLIENNQAYRGITVKNIYSSNPSGTKEQLCIETLQKHGLEEGDFCYVYSKTHNTQYTGIHQVEFLGDNGQDLEKKLRLKTKYNGQDNDLIIKKIINPSSDDIKFSGNQTITKITTSDITGGTSNANYIKVTTGNLSPAFSASTHNLRKSDYIEIRVNDTNYLMNGLHRVENIVDRYNFILDLKVGNTPNTVLSNINLFFHRLNGTPSDYYIRKFKLLSGSEYEVTKATSFGFSIYPKTTNNNFGVANDTWLFSFLNDINVKNKYNHRGGELTELYIATIKRAGENTFNWSDVTAHWDFQYSYADNTNKIETVSLNKVNGVGTIEKKLIDIDEYFGDFVEYNRFSLTEKILSKIIHRFALKTNPSPSNGYYIDPFQKIEIRKFSNEIETALSNEKVVGIPGDAELRPNGDTIWRDVLTPGFIEEGDNGVDYPFLNGANYIYTNKHIFVIRQEPDTVLELFKKEVKPIIVC